MTKLFEHYKNNFNIITGFILPKFDKQNGKQYIDEFQTILKKSDTKLYVMPIIESKAVMYKQIRMENLMEIRNILDVVSDNVLGVRVGGADLCNIFGVRRDVIHTIWDIAVVANCLSDVVNVFSRDYVVSGVVWEYFGENTMEEWALGLKREQELDYINGVIGKDAIHPSQLQTIQENLIVSYENYMDAISILNMNPNIGVEKGCGIAKMNEIKTHTNWAKKIVALANVYGVRKELN